MMRYFRLISWFAALASPACNSPSEHDDTVPDAADMRVVEPPDATWDADPGADSAIDADLPPADDAAVGEPDVPFIDQELTINSIIPNTGRTNGDTEVRMIGTGFFDEVEFVVGGVPCEGLVVESPNHVRCVAPAHPAGAVDVVVRHERPAIGGTRIFEDRLEDGFTYFEPLAITGVAPARGPLRGGVQVVVTGRGLLENTQLSIGGQPAVDVFLAADGGLVGLAPEGPPGPADVVVTSQAFNDSATASDAFFYYEELWIDAARPSVGPTVGGAATVISGRGLLESSRVLFGERGAEIVGGVADRRTLRLVAPGAAGPGPVDISVSNDNGEFTLRGGYVYFDETNDAFGVAGYVPQSGPVEGGNTVFVAGSGFEAGAHIEVDGRRVDCERVDAHQLQCVMPPSLAGAVDVVVVSNGDRRAFDDGYTYFESISLIAVLPNAGSVAGGTVVTLNGTGFRDGMDVAIGDLLLRELEIVDETTAVGTTPPNRAGSVDVTIATEFSRASIPGGFTYFDPTNRFGGVWGELINGSVNITVLNAADGQPLEEASVLLLTLDGLTSIEGISNAQGQITLSNLGLEGPVVITAAKEGFVVTTFEEVEVENVTIYLEPNDGNGSAGPGVEPPVVRGVVRGLDVLPKPSNERFVNVAVIEASHSGAHNRNQTLNALAAADPPPAAILPEDGQFAISARPGELAIVATAVEIDRLALKAYEDGDILYTELRQSFSPIAMGMRRFVSASPGTEINGIEISIDTPMDLLIPIDLDNPPAGGDTGPQIYGVLPRLNLGAEGYWEVDTQAASIDSVLTLNRMPRLDNWEADITYYFVGIAQSTTPETSFLPISVTIEETRDVDAGVFITPFVGTPFVLNPQAGLPLGLDRLVVWGVHDGLDGPITRPSANVVEIAEPALGPPKRLWRYVTPSLVTEFDFPALPDAAGRAGLGGGVNLLSITPFYVDGEFDYDEFTYDDIGGFRWKAWAVSATVPFAQ